MQNINIGKSGIAVPFLGMGTWAIGGGAWWGDNDDALSVKAIQTAVEQGIQWIDTAPIYGLYHSEEVVGEAMKHIDRDKVVLSTKCGLEWRHETPILHKVVDGVQVYRDLSAKSIIEDVEDSLRRLHTDHLDVLYTHWQSPDFGVYPLEETMEAMMKLKEQGKIRAIGASNVTSDIIRGYCKYGQLDVIQEKYSLLTRRIEKQLLPTCKELGVSVQAYSPLEQGLLTGKVTMDTTYHPQHEPLLPAHPPGTGAGTAGKVGRSDREVRLHHGAAGHRHDRPHDPGAARSVRCPQAGAGTGQRRCAAHQAGRRRRRPHEVGRGRDLLKIN
jgi:methylglyoxal reductase